MPNLEHGQWRGGQGGTTPIEFGTYLLFERISVGGMAEVFLALHRPTANLVALKRILSGLRGNPEIEAMFAAEANVVAHLSHPNIQYFYDYGTFDHMPYLAVEYIWGRDLAQVLARLTSQGKTLGLHSSCFLLAYVAGALDYVHFAQHNGNSLGLVHRDLSPGNIVVSFGGQPKLIDFGIAAATRYAPGTARPASLAGGKDDGKKSGVHGKVDYLSPEQVQGKEVDYRSDIFSLGAVLYECVTGAPPFAGDSDVATLERVLTGKIRPPSSQNPDVPRELDQILAIALARDPQRRFRRAAEFSAALWAFVRKDAQGWQERTSQAVRRLFVTELAKDQARFDHIAQFRGNVGGPLPKPRPPSSDQFETEPTFIEQVLVSHAEVGTMPSDEFPVGAITEPQLLGRDGWITAQEIPAGAPTKPDVPAKRVPLRTAGSRRRLGPWLVSLILLAATAAMASFRYFQPQMAQKAGSYQASGLLVIAPRKAAVDSANGKISVGDRSNSVELAPSAFLMPASLPASTPVTLRVGDNVVCEKSAKTVVGSIDIVNCAWSAVKPAGTLTLVGLKKDDEVEIEGKLIASDVARGSISLEADRPIVVSVVRAGAVLDEFEVVVGQGEALKREVVQSASRRK